MGKRKAKSQHPRYNIMRFIDNVGLRKHEFLKQRSLDKRIRYSKSVLLCAFALLGCSYFSVNHSGHCTPRHTAPENLLLLLRMLCFPLGIITLIFKLKYQKSDPTVKPSLTLWITSPSQEILFSSLYFHITS